MKTLGLDLSTSICGWSISTDDIVNAAGFINISKASTFKEKANLIIETLKNYSFDKVNVEETLSGFSNGFTSQQTLIKLVQNKSVVCYILEEKWNKPFNFYNVNTMRKKVLGAARIKGIKPKEFVKLYLPKIVPNLKTFDKLNRDGNWDVHNSDTYDAIVCSLYK